MGDARGRYAAAAIYVAALTLFTYARAVFEWDGDPGFLNEFWILLVPFAVVGFLVGRWWVLPVLFVPAILTIPLGEDPLDSDRVAYSWQVLMVTAAGSPLALAGYLLRLAVDRLARGDRAREA
jgi:hypothetical protein